MGMGRSVLTSQLTRACAAIVVLLIAAACSKTPEEARRAYIATGDEYFAQKKYSEASIEYRRALQQDPRYAIGYDKLGDASTAAGDPKGALSAYVRASDLATDNVAINLKAGNLLLVARRFQDAKTRARNILVKEPNNVSGLVLLGNALAGLQSVDEAVDVAKRAVELDPNRAGLLGNLGVFELARGNTGEAESAFRKAVTTSPKSVAPLLALANLYQTVGRMADAERSLRQALVLEPRNVPANATLAAVLIQMRRAAEAEPYLKIATDAVGTTDASGALADYYVSVGRIGEGLAMLQKLSATKEGYAVARIKTAMIDYASGRRDAAHKGLREVLARDPKNASALALEARLLLAENRFDDATALVTEALAADPRSSQAYFALGKIQLAKGAAEAARKAFVEALTIDPSRTDAQIEVSGVHLARRELDSAINYARTAIKTAPDNLDAHLALVRALSVRPDDLPRADVELRDLLARYPNSPDVHSMLGMIALRRDNPVLARRSFERALRVDADHVEALTGLTTLDAEAGRMRDAQARVESRLAAVKTPPPDLLLLAAKIYVATRQFEKTEQSLRRIIEVDPTNLAGYGLLGQYYVTQRKLPEATREFSALVERDPKSVSAYTMLGLLAHARGDVDAERKAYERAVQIDAQAPVASSNLAWIYANVEGGNLEVALQLAQTAHARIPDSGEIADTLAFVYYKKEMGSFAVPLLTAALDKEPNKPEYHYHLGLVYAQAGEDAKARKAFQTALKLNPGFAGAEHARRVMATLIY
jgi:putative PEP-CTERM system TPR-repeat lipoprotein